MALVALFLTFWQPLKKIYWNCSESGALSSKLEVVGALEPDDLSKPYRLRPALRGVIPARCTGRLRRRIDCGLCHADGLLRRCRGGQSGFALSGILIVR